MLLFLTRVSFLPCLPDMFCVKISANAELQTKKNSSLASFKDRTVRHKVEGPERTERKRDNHDQYSTVEMSNQNIKSSRS